MVQGEALFSPTAVCEHPRPFQISPKPSVNSPIMEMNYDAKVRRLLTTGCTFSSPIMQVLHQIEEELHIELLPGTELMADIGSHHFVKSGDKSHRVLVPQPSDDKHDPLNWSLGWKIAAITASSFVTFMQGFGPLSLAPMFGDYIQAFHCTLPDAIQFTGVAILVLGFSNFIWYVCLSP